MAESESRTLLNTLTLVDGTTVSINGEFVLLLPIKKRNEVFCVKVHVYRVSENVDEPYFIEGSWGSVLTLDPENSRFVWPGSTGEEM